LSIVMCVIRLTSLRRADHSSRGVLWKSVCCECCVLSGRGLCDGLITRPEETYRLGVSECDRENSIMRRRWPNGGEGCRAI